MVEATVDEAVERDHLFGLLSADLSLSLESVVDDTKRKNRLALSLDPASFSTTDALGALD